MPRKSPRTLVEGAYKNSVSIQRHRISVAGIFLEHCGIAESAHGGVAGLSRTHGGEVFGDLLVEMKFAFRHLIAEHFDRDGIRFAT
jgi:hypothetical protein